MLTFLKDFNISKIDSVCLAVAGPIVNQTVKLTNLPWKISAKILKKEHSHYSLINFDEPFRIFLSLIFHRLDNFQNTASGYESFTEFKKDIELFNKSVSECFKHKSPNKNILKFIDYIDEFEFHGVSMDIREDSSVLKNASSKSSPSSLAWFENVSYVSS